MVLIALFAQILPLDEQVYEMLTRLEVRGIFVKLPDTRPYTLSQLEESFQWDVEVSPRDQFDLVALGFISAPQVNRRWAPVLRLQADDASFFLGGTVMASYRYSDTLHMLRAGPEIRYQGSIGPVGFFATHRVTFAPSWPDTVFDAKSWRGDERPVFAEIPDARLDLDLFPWLHLQAGRSQMHMGPVPNGGLILSTEPWGIDHAAYTLKWNGVSFTTLFSWLQSDKRMVLHRFEYVAPRWKLGLTEVVISNDSNDIFPYLAAPVAFYYFMQWNKRQDENILWGADASVILSPFRIYTELLVDDFAYEPATGPNKIGATLGGEWISILKSDVDLRIDYTAITKWTYAQRFDNQNYTFRGRLLGDDLGPDADRGRLVLSWRALPRLSFEALGFFERHGEGDVWRDIADDSANTPEEYHPPFPSGVVEGHLGGELDVKFRLIGRSYLSLSGGIQRVSNIGHVEDSTAFRPFLQTDLYWEF